MPIGCYNNDGDNMDKKYLTSAEIAEKWGVSERSVRNYCNEGRVEGAVLIGKFGIFQKMLKSHKD